MRAEAERRVDGKWQEVSISPPLFDWRSYGVYGFLADVRNYSAVPAVAPHRGVPSDFSGEAEQLGDHSFTWVSLDELLRFDYDAEVEDRRVSVEIAPNVIHGGMTADAGSGRKTTFREFLDSGFFEEIERAKQAGVERIVMGFNG